LPPWSSAEARLGVQDIIDAQPDFFSLTKNEIHVALLGVLVFDELLVLVRQDALLHVELWTIGRHLRPVVAPLKRIEAQLQKIYLRPLPGHLD